MGQAPGALAARRGLLSPSPGGGEGGLTQAAAEGEKDQVGPRAGWPDQHCTGSSTDPLSPPVKLAVSPSRAPVAVSSLARRPRSAMETPVLCNKPLGCTVKRSRAFSSPLPHHVLCLPLLRGKLEPKQFNQRNEEHRSKGKQSEETKE